jgi:hypothetical protein
VNPAPQEGSLDPLRLSHNLYRGPLVPFNDSFQGHHGFVECNRRFTRHVARHDFFHTLDLLAGNPYLRFGIRSPASRDLQHYNPLSRKCGLNRRKNENHA